MEVVDIFKVMVVDVIDELDKVYNVGLFIMFEGV